MRVIRIDEEVWKCLEQRARPFVDSPNDVLRRVFGLNEASSRVQNDQGMKDNEVVPVMKNIRAAGLAWLRGELSNPNSPMSVFLSKHAVYQRGFDFCKKNARVSKYYKADESFPGIPVWWQQIPLEWVSAHSNTFSFALLLCQKQPSNFSDFVCLTVPLEYLNSEYSKGHLDILGNHICLHLSTEDCVYRGYEVKMFDDVRLTMRKGMKPVPFGQFLL
jgi:hypothetical protein